MAYDVRAIANVVLDRAEHLGISVTNLSINKILYFAHGHFLAHFNKPLLREKAEAWEFGPVYREIYRQFSSFEKKSINARAKKLDVSSGKMVEFSIALPPNELKFIAPVIDFYIRIPAWKLVELSHEPDGPWDRIWNHLSPSNPGMIIPDDLVAEYFRQHESPGGSSSA
ncbi:Panacea domain-containing protein [Microvirga arsenatis]|uniref:DUF4065 domain-containing protein n=1 Tax=Microvirga arsenatis TaxID=2692265 RepID=A0ABW9YU68_9HYPH|nr:type II toxin-antitoxin system antitoxin SocA domain-containing protein [Microvirga arsenatis]NBJ09481.1 DUF4065 domain-containing protein [Microvirga arsenatis]NBJ23660.1 DUF4065 domain-containing protein [Microvirga arsenatis]